jgi:hypothetical protein
MEYIYNFNGTYLTLNEFKNDIINDWVNTNKTKKELHKLYPVSTTTLARVLKGIKKEYYECLECNETNPNKFHITNKKRCKICYSKNNSIWYKSLSNDKKNNKLNKIKIWQNNNIIKIRVLGAKHRAKRKNLDFDIDENYIETLLIKQNYRCLYTNVKLELTMGSDDSHINPNTLSIDRIDPKLGYTKNNIALVSAIVNNMKNDLKETSFLEVINLIYKNYKKNF